MDSGSLLRRGCAGVSLILVMGCLVFILPQIAETVQRRMGIEALFNDIALHPASVLLKKAYYRGGGGTSIDCNDLHYTALLYTDRPIEAVTSYYEEIFVQFNWETSIDNFLVANIDQHTRIVVNEASRSQANIMVGYSLADFDALSAKHKTVYILSISNMTQCFEVW